MTTVADILAEEIVTAGVETVFGLPGGENVPLMAALQRRGVRFVLVRNEATAVYMADVTARLSGKPGVCLTTLGPGIMNAAAGIGHAFLDRAPVVILSACMDAVLRHMHTHQTLDQNAIIGPMTKASMTISEAQTAQSMMREALWRCQHGRPGPVHIQLSRQTAASPTPTNKPTNQQTIQPTIHPPIPHLPPSHRPLLIVGLGLEPERPYAALRALAERLQAPVVLTPKAKGAFPADHPLYGGTIGLTRTDPAYELLAESDLIIAIGYDVVELVKPWDEQAPLVWLAPWANNDPPLAAVAEWVGQLAPALDALAQAEPLTHADWGAARVARFWEMWRRQEAQRPEPAPGRMRPQAVLQALEAVLPADTTVTTDVGSHKILTSLDWPSRTPNRFFLSNGLSSMGFGVPAAIAASLALGGAPAVAITGDGGFGMVIGELNLIHELQTPVIVVIMNDGALDLIRSAQFRAGQPMFGTEFTNPNFGQIAAAYGLPFCRAADPQTVQTAVAQAGQQRTPLLLEALIDPASYPTAGK